MQFFFSLTFSKLTKREFFTLINGLIFKLHWLLQLYTDSAIFDFPCIPSHLSVRFVYLYACACVCYSRHLSMHATFNVDSEKIPVIFSHSLRALSLSLCIFAGLCSYDEFSSRAKTDISNIRNWLFVSWLKMRKIQFSFVRKETLDRFLLIIFSTFYFSSFSILLFHIIFQFFNI